MHSHLQIVFHWHCHVTTIVFFLVTLSMAANVVQLFHSILCSDLTAGMQLESDGLILSRFHIGWRAKDVKKYPLLCGLLYAVREIRMCWLRLVRRSNGTVRRDSDGLCQEQGKLGYNGGSEGHSRLQVLCSEQVMQEIVCATRLHAASNVDGAPLYRFQLAVLFINCMGEGIMRRIVFFFLIGFPMLLFAQRRDTSSVLADEAERRLDDATELYAESGEETIDGSDLLEELASLRAHPVNIHLADDACLGGLLGLTGYQLYQLRRYVFLHGYLQSPLELLSVDGFSMETVQRIRPYIVFGKPPEPERPDWKRLSSGRSELLMRWGRVLESRKGYRRDSGTVNGYEGGADAMLLKYSYRCDDFFRLGLVAEKDAGEAFFNGSNKQGFDYLSFYIQYIGNGLLRNLVIGDYQLQFGQALAMGMGFHVRSSDPEALRGDAYGLKPHTSSNESQFFRGTALTLRTNRNTTATFFVSFCGRDAENGDSVYRSHSFSGYHRTMAEIAREGCMGEGAGGLYVSRNGRSFHSGVGCYFLGYSLPLEELRKPYAQYRFSGSRLWNGSADFIWNLKKSVLFGETAFCGDAAALAGGMIYDADASMRFSVLLHLFPRGYHCIPELLGSTSGCSNEYGISCRSSWLIGKRGTIETDWSFSYFPWLLYRADAPSCASMFQARYQTVLHERGGWLMQYRWMRSENNVVMDALRVLNSTDRHTSRLRWSWSPSERWQFRVQLDGISVGGRKEGYSRGVMWTQRITCKFCAVRYVFSFSCFDTDSYQAAIYVSESDVRYATSAVGCSGRGVRLYGLLSLPISPAWIIYARISVFRYYDRETIGSGADQIMAPHKTELKLQLIWKG